LTGGACLTLGYRFLQWVEHLTSSATQVTQFHNDYELGHTKAAAFDQQTRLKTDYSSK